MARGGRPGTHLDRSPSQSVGGCERRFVGDVVADDQRNPSAERGLAHELADGHSLVAPARLDLPDHLSSLHLEVRGERFGKATYRALDLRPERGSKAVMH